jgi:hypothetical protein
MVEKERVGEVDRLVARLGAEKTLDLQAAEFFVRKCVLALGAEILEQYLALALRDERPPICAHKHLPCAMRSDGKRTKSVVTILGKIELRRTRFVCPSCGLVRYCADELLDVQETGFSPGVRRLMALTGASDSFGQDALLLKATAEIDVGAKDIERVAEAVGERERLWEEREASKALAAQSCGLAPADSPEPIETLYVNYDGTGTPMRAEELEGIKGKGEDGRARTREAKIGCVFTQTTVDEEGWPVRDEHSTTYVGAIEPSVDFGYRIRGEAVRRGMGQAKRVVVITDGAAYNKTIIAEHFSHATAILDLFHAKEHLADFMKNAAGEKIEGPLHQRCLKALKAGRIETLLNLLHAALPRSGARRKTGLKEMAYFKTNIEAMRYGRYRKQGLFVGSGVVEAGGKVLVGKRLKQSGMFWSKRGANAIIALRSCILSNRFEQFWEDQVAV